VASTAEQLADGTVGKLKAGQNVLAAMRKEILGNWR
jgi:hypothetical protein